MLHKIDKPNGKYTKQELDKFMVFCILDTAVPYEMVCKAFDALEKNKMVTRKQLASWFEGDIAQVLKKSGYRFPNQHAARLAEFADNTINLQTCSRQELV